MSDYKLSSEEVPKKFAEWLLSMGCPPEKVPTLDKVVEMCRGQYYMVWRSLMEHVEPKDVIRQKRLHVFCDDVYKWKRKNAFNKPDPSTVMPEELTLWHQHCNVKERVANAEERVKQARQNLNLLMDKISTKMSHHELSRRGLQRAQRRAWLLQQVAGELTTKRENLQETRSIADSLCSTQEDVDVQSKLERYLLSKRSPSSQVTPSTSLLATNPVASSSVVSNGDVIDNEEQLSVLASSRGAALWPPLLARRAGLVPTLRDAPANLAVAGPNPQSVVSHTAAMHCNLALEALKNRAHIKHTRQRLAAAVSDLNTYLSGEACELLVVRCEQARAGARVAALRSLLADVTSRAALFAAADVTSRAALFAAAGAAGRRAGGGEIAAVDKAIESKKEEIKKLVAALAATEKKMYGARECLISIFKGFHKDSPLNENQSMNRYRGQVELPQESMATLRQFYEERREKRTRKVELSLDLDTSDNCSFTEIDNATPKFADELRIYLKKFNLENNRKLVLESGEKIWAFETMESAIERLYLRLKNIESNSILVCPSVGLSRSLKALAERVSLSAALDSALAVYTSSLDRRNFDMDITPRTKEEESLVDQIKKRLNDNLLSLQKTGKTLELGQENLCFWSQNEMKKHISCSRVVNRKTYKEYEEIYVLHLE